MWQDVSAWSWTWLWNWTNGFTKAIVFLLLIMLLHSCVLFFKHIWRLQAAAKQIPALDSAVTAANAGGNGVFAGVIAAGFEAFQSAPPSCSNTEAVGFARSAMARRGVLVHAVMKRGITSIATIAALAPFVGLAGTVVGLLGAFRGGSNTPTGWLVFYGNAIALSLLPTAFGILVGVVAVWFHNHLIRRMELFDVQSAKVLALVIRCLNTHNTDQRHAHNDRIPTLALFSGCSLDREASYDRHRILLASVWVVWLYVLATIAWACVWNLRYGP